MALILEDAIANVSVAKSNLSKATDINNAALAVVAASKAKLTLDEAAQATTAADLTTKVTSFNSSLQDLIDAAIAAKV